MLKFRSVATSSQALAVSWESTRYPSTSMICKLCEANTDLATMQLHQCQGRSYQSWSPHVIGLHDDSNTPVEGTS